MCLSAPNAAWADGLVLTPDGVGDTITYNFSGRLDGSNESIAETSQVVVRRQTFSAIDVNPSRHALYAQVAFDALNSIAAGASAQPKQGDAWGANIDLPSADGSSTTVRVVVTVTGADEHEVDLDATGQGSAPVRLPGGMMFDAVTVHLTASFRDGHLATSSGTQDDSILDNGRGIDNFSRSWTLNP